MLLAAGLAIQGAKPVCAIYSTFLQRAYDQIVHDVCLQELDVTFAMDRAGPGRRRRPDPPRRLRHLLLPLPAERRPDGAARRGAARPHAPHRARAPGARSRCAIRAAPRSACRCPEHAELLPIGTGETLRPGERVALLGYGFGTKVALDAANELAEHGISATVADARFAKPLDTELINRARRRPRAARRRSRTTSSMGGFGSAVLEHLEDTIGPGADRARVHARRPPRPLRHARQARAPARGGRADRRGGGRAGPQCDWSTRARDRLTARVSGCVQSIWYTAFWPVSKLLRAARR